MCCAALLCPCYAASHFVCCAVLYCAAPHQMAPDASYETGKLQGNCEITYPSDITKRSDVTLQVANLKALKNETNIPLVQLLDSPTTLIPGEPRNRVSHFCASPHPLTHTKLLCITFAATWCKNDCCTVLLQPFLCASKHVVMLCHMVLCHAVANNNSFCATAKCPLALPCCRFDAVAYPAYACATAK